MSNDNGLMCELETGICGDGNEETVQSIDLNGDNKKNTLYYVTDPICSHCWALEPVLNAFLRQYGHYFNVKVVMGGLLPSWDGFADKSNGIQKPSDVAEHWREVGVHSRMPIDGSLWMDNPILSSYPPSRVFKVIQNKHAGKEQEFLRRARQAVFVFNRNIGEEKVLVGIVNGIGLDGEKVVEESGFEAAQDLLEQDFQLASSLGVRGFPTIIMVNEENKGVKIVGARSLETYVDSLKQISQQGISPRNVPSMRKLLEEEGLLFSKEIETMYGIGQSDVESFVRSELEGTSYEAHGIMDEFYFTI